MSLTGVYRMSRREVLRLLRDAFAVKIALGTVSNTKAQMSRALGEVHSQALDAVRTERVLHVDETPCRLKGTMPWLGTATTDEVTAYRVDQRRSFEALTHPTSEGAHGAEPPEGERACTHISYTYISAGRCSETTEEAVLEPE